jgi:hypothetical protein
MDHDTDGSHLAAVRRELADLPESLQQTATAAAAEGLARSLDLGTETYRFQAALVAQLRECMAELTAKAPAKVEGDSVDDLNARRAARRVAASAG